MTGRSGNHGSRLRAHGAVLVSALLLSACADTFAGMSLPSLPKLQNPFSDKEVPLTGKRISVMQKENVRRAGVGRPADLAALAAPERGLDAARRHAEQRARPPRPRAGREERLERGCRRRLQLLGQADQQPDRLWQQGLHTRRERPGVRVQPVGRLGLVAGLDHAAQREGPGRLRRWSGSGWWPYLRGDRFRHGGGARPGNRQEAVGEERRSARARLSDRRRRARVRGHHGGSRPTACRGRTAPSFGRSAARRSAPVS